MDKLPRRILHVMVATGAIYGRSSYRKSDKVVLALIAVAVIAFLVLAAVTYQ